MERKFKIGDKVRIVKINDEVNGRANKYLNKIAVVTGYWEECYKLDVDNHAFEWYDDELELAKESIFDKLAHSITEAAKEANILVEPTEDGGIKISPLEVKPKPSESGIYIDKELPHVHVIFGGKIHVAVGECKAENRFAIGLQELEEFKECGEIHNEEWVKEKPTVNLVINNKNTIKILRDALDMIELKLSKEEKE